MIKNVTILLRREEVLSHDSDESCEREREVKKNLDKTTEIELICHPPLMSHDSDE